MTGALPELFDGLMAGYGIAMPIGAVSVLIFSTGMRSGLLKGFMAGAGAATADLLYAAIAVIGGSALVRVLLPIGTPLRITGGAVLIALAAYGVWQGFRKKDPKETTVVKSGPFAAYAQLLGITAINPLTVVYFAAFIVGRDPAIVVPIAGRIAFVLGVAAASLSWQTLLAGLGSIAHNRLPERFRLLAVLAGNLVVAALGARILVLALR
jgi:arginine exporter protein ArgO